MESPFLFLAAFLARTCSLLENQYWSWSGRFADQGNPMLSHCQKVRQEQLRPSLGKGDSQSRRLALTSAERERLFEVFMRAPLHWPLLPQ